MITEDYVSFETAKLLKEKGFAETSNTIGTYSDKGEFYLYKHEKGYNHNHLTSWYSAPTIQMAMKWLRKKHNLYIDNLLLELKDGEYGYVIQDITERKYLGTSGNDSYQSPEESAEAAIKYCLENLI